MLNKPKQNYNKDYISVIHSQKKQNFPPLVKLLREYLYIITTYERGAFSAN
jgi:hypothetical protein